MPNPVAEKTFKNLEERYSIKYLTKDTVIVSYPKSGRTWLRMILAKLLVNIGYDHSEYEMVPVFHKSYKEINDLFSKDIKVVFLHRHPGDVLVSHWKELSTSHRSGETMIMKNFKFYHFLKDEEWGIKQLINFNNGWLTNFYKFKSFKTITYEAMKKDTFKTVKKVVDFLEFNCTDEQIKDAIEYSRFENMKKIEIGEGTNYLKHYKGNFGQELENEVIKEEFQAKGTVIQPRIRKGKVGGYIEDLKEREIELIKKHLKDSIYKYE